MLKDKVVVVSGVGRGLGRAVARRAAEAGADVVLAARTESVLAEVAAEVRETGRDALAVPTDVTDPASAGALAETALATFGGVDVLVNNALAVPPLDNLVDVDPDAVRGCLDVDVFAALRMSQLFADSLAARAGAIVMVSSAAVRRVRPGFGAYAVAKTGTIALARGLATDLGPRGVRVNTVVPGNIWADALQGYFSHLATERGVTTQHVYDETAAGLDLRRLPEPDQVADAILFLASTAAGAVTGQTLDVTSGEFHH